MCIHPVLSLSCHSPQRPFRSPCWLSTLHRESHQACHFFVLGFVFQEQRILICSFCKWMNPRVQEEPPFILFVQAYLGETAALVADHPRKSSVTATWVVNFLLVEGFAFRCELLRSWEAQYNEICLHSLFCSVSYSVWHRLGSRDLTATACSVSDGRDGCQRILL